MLHAICFNYNLFLKIKKALFTMICEQGDLRARDNALLFPLDTHNQELGAQSGISLCMSSGCQCVARCTRCIMPG